MEDDVPSCLRYDITAGEAGLLSWCVNADNIKAGERFAIIRNLVENSVINMVARADCHLTRVVEDNVVVKAGFVTISTIPIPHKQRSDTRDDNNNNNDDGNNKARRSDRSSNASTRPS